jgi:transcription antitermination factor NusG
VFTRHQNERSVARHLDTRDVELFFPTYETVHKWKNRVSKKVVLPLFPSYVFVRICRAEYSMVLSCPGALRIAGNSRGPMPVSDLEIEFLRSESYGRRAEPFSDFLVGDRVRIARGALKGLEGTLVRKQNNALRFVLAVELIRQSISVEIAFEDVELVKNTYAAASCDTTPFAVGRPTTLRYPHLSPIPGQYRRNVHAL